MASWALDGGSGLAAARAIDDRARELGMRVIRIGAAQRAAAEGTVAEQDGVVARWFGRHECAAAIVRPDHYVFGVASDAPSLSAMMSELSSRLQ